MSKKGSRRGGRREGAGRPRKANARTVNYSIAVSLAEKDEITLVGDSTWARKVLLRAARRRRTKLAREGDSRG